MYVINYDNSINVLYNVLILAVWWYTTAVRDVFNGDPKRVWATSGTIV